MLACQLGALLVTVVPRGVEFAREVISEVLAWRRERRGAARRLADAVRSAMAREPSIMERRYADRWLMRVHGRGLGGRAPVHGELGHTVLPFTVLPSQLARQLSRQLSHQLSRRPASRRALPEHN